MWLCRIETCFLTHFFLRIMSHLLKNVYWTPSYTPETYKSRIEKHKILKCVCLSSFWIGCAKKDRKIYPLNLSILQQITVNGVNFCTAYVFGRLTPARTLSISGLKYRVWKLSFLSLKMMEKSGLEFILKFTQPLQRYLLSCHF